jgi:hypothetical protein
MTIERALPGVETMHVATVRSGIDASVDWDLASADLVAWRALLRAVIVQGAAGRHRATRRDGS